MNPPEEKKTSFPSLTCLTSHNVRAKTLCGLTKAADTPPS